ncbi:MAG: hypothetical protein ACRDQ7_27910 [Haloechinothrix sp.]
MITGRGAVSMAMGDNGEHASLGLAGVLAVGFSSDRLPEYATWSNVVDSDSPGGFVCVEVDPGARSGDLTSTTASPATVPRPDGPARPPGMTASSCGVRAPTPGDPASPAEWEPAGRSSRSGLLPRHPPAGGLALSPTEPDLENAVPMDVTHSARLRWTALAGAGAVLLLAVAPSGAAAEEPEEAGCPVVAAAQGVQVMVSASDNLLLQAPSGAGVPVAQACVDYGIQDSSGFAANPYPGSTVVALPALLRGQTGQAVPDYPAYVASRHPSVEESKAERQGHALSSRSTATSTKAQARSGVGSDAASAGSAAALAEAVVNPDTRQAIATATAETQPLTINDVLRLGEVRSVATAKVDAAGKVTRDSQLRIGRTEVAGQVVEITPDGVRAAGQPVGLPDANPAEALEQVGVRVRYLAQEKTARGVLSAGIEIFARHQDPQSGAVYTAQYTFGRSFAAAQQVERPAGRAGGDVPLPPVQDSGSAGAAPVAEDVPVGDAVAGGPAPAEAPLPAAGPPDSAAAPEPVIAAPARLAGNPVDMGVTGLYLVLVFGAVAMFACGTLLRLLGVKTRWTS